MVTSRIVFFSSFRCSLLLNVKLGLLLMIMNASILNFHYFNQTFFLYLCFAAADSDHSPKQQTSEEETSEEEEKDDVKEPSFVMKR